MSTTSPQHAPARGERHLERWHHLHDERRFRLEQLAALDSGDLAGERHSTIDTALRSASRAALREIDAALARLQDGRYGWCVACSRPLPDARLDVLPMAPLCMSCHYEEQNRHTPGPGHSTARP